MDINQKKQVLPELLCTADTKWVLGHWYIKAILNGRTVPDFTSMAAIAQDELGHTRALFRFLEQELDLPEFQLEFARGSDEIHNMQLLDEAPQNWADFVTTVYLAELALWRGAEAQRNGEWRPTAKMFSQFGEEGYFHRLYIEGWIEAFTEEEKRDAEAALERRLPFAAQWFADMPEAFAKFSEDVVGRFVSDVGCDKAKVESLLAVEPVANWDAKRRRPASSAMPDTLWEFIVPTNPEAVAARRPLAVSIDDNIDLFEKANAHRETEPQFD